MDSRRTPAARPRLPLRKPKASRILLVKLWLLAASAAVAQPGATPSAPVSANPQAARELLHQRRWPEAEVALRGLVAQSPRKVEWLTLHAQALRRIGKLKEAIAQLESAVALAPRYRPAREALGSAYLLNREPERALEQLQLLQRQCGNCRESRDLTEAIAAYSP